MHRLPLNKIVLEWSIYPIATIKISFGSGLDFTSKVWTSPKKLKKSIKTVKIESSELNKKKTSQGIALRNICTKFGAHWKIFKYRNYDTTSVTHTKRPQNHTMTDI